jgi:hypothetical protein
MTSQRTKAHTLPSRTSRHTSQNLAKSVLFPTQKEIQFFFSLPSEKIKTPDTQTNTTKTEKLNNDNGLQTRWTRTQAGNSGFASCGVNCFNSSVVFQFNFSAGLTVLCPEIPHERKAAKRYVAFRK